MQLVHLYPVISWMQPPRRTSQNSHLTDAFQAETQNAFLAGAELQVPLRDHFAAGKRQRGKGANGKEGRDLQPAKTK